MRIDAARAVGADGAITVDVAGREFEVRIASGCDDFEQAFLLLAEKYRARGYEGPGIKPFRFTPFHVLPETITVVAREGVRVVATLSLVPDTTLMGLPLEKVYPDEVARLRREGRGLAEVTGLAEDGLELREFLSVFVAMIRVVLQHHTRNGGDTWVIAVNPRHGRFYRQAMGCVPLGGRRVYPSVCDAPAEALWGDPMTMRANAPAMYDHFFNELLPSVALDPASRSPDHVDFFGTHSATADPATFREVASAVDGRAAGPRWWDVASAA